MSQPPIKQRPLPGFRITFSCDLSAAREATKAAKAFLEKQSLPEVELNGWELVIAEAANNAVNHSSGTGAVQKIVLDLIIEPDVIEVRVTDHTPGFDWPEEAVLPEMESETGRGIFLIQTFVDHASYLRSSEENCLIMCKNRTSIIDTFPGDRKDSAILEARLEETEQTLQSMTEELASCYESLSGIFRFSSELNQVRSTEEFARRLLEHLLIISEADWFLFRLHKADPELQGGLCSTYSKPIPPLYDLEHTVDASSSEIQSVSNRQDIWFDDQAPLSPDDPLRSAGEADSGIVHPIFLNDDLVGVLTLGRQHKSTSFTAAQCNVLYTFADFLSFQILNSRMQETKLKARMVARELEIARGIQISLLPPSLPKVPPFSFAGGSESAREVGGDFYDVIQCAPGQLLLVIADVMGKGIPAAMFAATLRSLFRARAELSPHPGKLLSKANHILFEDLSRVEMFITLQLVYLDAPARTLTVANAGHCPFLLVEKDGQAVREISPDGMPLGIELDTAYEETRLDFGSIERGLLYTDGLTEARNSKGDMFGTQRLNEWLLHFKEDASSASEIKRNLMNELQKFQADTLPQDDQTFLIFAREQSEGT